MIGSCSAQWMPSVEVAWPMPALPYPAGEGAGFIR